MDADTLLTTTRSVRRKLDLDRPVAPEVITECLTIAMQAPIAGALLSALRWVVVRDPTLRSAIADLVRPAGLASMERYGRGANPRTLSSGRYLLDVLERVPAFVIPCLCGRPEGPHAYLSAFYGSAYPAIWSFQLALRSRGLGSTIFGYHLADHQADVAALLGIPEDVTQITMLPVAYTTTTDFHPAARPPIETITYQDRWPDGEEVA
jgi:nitroreductase